MDICDGLLLPGGNRVISTNFDVIDYFYKNNKPMLGICLGMQTLAMYSVNIEQDNKRIIKKIDNGVDHWPTELFRDNNDTLVHSVFIEKDSKLYDIFKQDMIEVNSVHTYIADKVPDCLKVVAKSGDGQVEVIENSSKKFFIGIKYHPELLVDYDEKQNRIFEEFVYTCKN